MIILSIKIFRLVFCRIDNLREISYNRNNELVILGGNVLEVDIDKLLPVTEARDNFNKIIDEVEGSDLMYVLTKNGKPSASPTWWIWTMI